MPSYTITEPRPTVAQNSYAHTGRGGAGNLYRATPGTAIPSGSSSSTVTSLPAPSGRFYSGRGGAGNAHAASERPVLSFDEEYLRSETRERSSAAVGTHVGRGGAGNVYGKGASKSGNKARKQSDASSHSVASHDSAASSVGSGSVRSSGFWGRISGASLGHH